MIFNSIEFLAFLPITFILYWIFPKKSGWIILLLASYVFYMWWNPKLSILIITTTIVSYLTGILIHKYQDNKTLKKLILSICLIVCFSILLFFKYFSFLYQSFWDLINLFFKKEMPGVFNIILPVGISFYTFQTASYVIDIYNNKIKPEYHLGYYALYVSFFPQLVAGPIERPDNLIPQLKTTKVLKEIDYGGAFRIMLVGFFKKIAIADSIGTIVNQVYSDLSNANGLMVLIAVIIFPIQIYCDFSGYSDIAVGCAKLFGVDLMENFNKPYSSKSVKEFWTRWHISLSLWLRDYIYFPLGGSRKGKVRHYLNIFIVFLVSGLWHGANFTYILWGVLLAFFQIIEDILHNFKNKHNLYIIKNSIIKDKISVILNCIIIAFTFMVFRSNTVSDIGLVLSKIFSPYHENSLKYAINSLNINVFKILYFCIISLFLFFTEAIKKPYVYTNNIIVKKSFLRFTIYVLMIWFIIIVWFVLQSSDIQNSFIYFQF